MSFHPTHEAYLTQLEFEVGPGNWLYGSERCETNAFDNAHQNKFENIFLSSCSNAFGNDQNASSM
eukprot:2789546-Prorocentrum_lima.AAC.1